MFGVHTGAKYEDMQTQSVPKTKVRLMLINRKHRKHRQPIQHSQHFVFLWDVYSTLWVQNFALISHISQPRVRSKVKWNASEESWQHEKDILGTYQSLSWSNICCRTLMNTLWKPSSNDKPGSDFCNIFTNVWLLWWTQLIALIYVHPMV